MSHRLSFIVRFVWLASAACVWAVILAGCASNENTTTTPDSGVTATDAMTFFNDTGSARDSTTTSMQDSTLPPDDTGTGFPDTGFDSDFGDTDLGDTALPPFDAGMPPPGVLVTTGADLRIWGVTDDGYVIYSSTALASVYAVRLSGTSPGGADAGDGGGPADSGHPDAEADAGHADAAHADAGHDAAVSDAGGDGSTMAMATPMPLVGIDASAIVLVQHDVVFIFSGFNFISGAGTLAIWTSAGGLHMVSTASVPGNLSVTPFSTTLSTTPGEPTLSIATSSDSSTVLFLDNASPENDETADVYAAETSTGAKTKLVAGASLEIGYPSLGFAGTTPGAMSAIVAAQGASFTYAIHAFSVPGFTPTVTIPQTSTWAWSADGAGTKLLAFTPPAADGGTGGAVVYPLEADAGAPMTVDPSGASGVLTSDGANAIYVSATGALMRSPVAAPSPVTLVPAPATPIAGILGLSPSEDTALFFEQMGSNEGASDLYAASTLAPGPVTTLNGTQTAALFFQGDSFTVDSTNALFLSNYTPPLITGPTVGTMTAGAVSPDAGAPATFGSNSIMGWATTGAKAVFDEGYVAAGTADIQAVDLSTTAQPTTLVPSASPYFYLSPSKALVVYSWSVSPSLAGIYAVPAP